MAGENWRLGLFVVRGVGGSKTGELRKRVFLHSERGTLATKAKTHVGFEGNFLGFCQKEPKTHQECSHVFSDATESNTGLCQPQLAKFGQRIE